MKKRTGKRVVFIIVFGLFFIIVLFFMPFDDFQEAVKNSESKNVEEDFTVVVLPDTQLYAQDHPEIFTQQTQWIIDNKDKLNIKFVVHVGDIVQDAFNESEWKRANESMSLLDGKIPYLIVPGNHDRQPTFNTYFPYQRFESYDWYGGYYGKKTKEDGYILGGGMENSFGFFSSQDNEFLVLGMQFCPSDEILKWADEILRENIDKEAIVFTHLYMSNGKNRVTHNDYLNCKRYSYCDEPGSCNNGEEMWEELIKNHNNIKLVLSGHVFPPGRGQRTDCVLGNPIYQILQNYQHLEMGGNGWLRYYTFKPNENIIEAKTYSPYLAEFSLSSSDNFNLLYHPDNCIPDTVDLSPDISGYSIYSEEEIERILATE